MHVGGVQENQTSKSWTDVEWHNTKEGAFVLSLFPCLFFAYRQPHDHFEHCEQNKHANVSVRRTWTTLPDPRAPAVPPTPSGQTSHYKEHTYLCSQVLDAVLFFMQFHDMAHLYITVTCMRTYACV